MRFGSSFLAFVTVLFALDSVSCCLPIRNRHQEAASPSPVWTTDLRRLGFIPHEFGGLGKHEASRQIAFGSNEELVVLDPPGTFARPGEVRAFVVETTSGRVVRQARWQIRHSAGVFATAEGGYAVVTADGTSDGTSLFSPGLHSVISGSPYVAQMVSPDRRALKVWTATPGHAVTFFLDAGTLQPTGVEYVNEEVYAVSRDQIVTRWGRGRREVLAVLGPWGEVFTYETDCDEPYPVFLTKRRIVWGSCDRIEVIDFGQGLLLARETAGFAHVAAVSIDGSRFAIVEEKFTRAPC